MKYDDLRRSVENLDFVKSREEADAAIKATLGIMVSGMREDDAREFTASLPDQLTLEKLRGHQQNQLEANQNEYIKVIANQFNYNEDQAERLVSSVLNSTRQEIPQDKVKAWDEKIPRDWVPLIERDL